MWDFITLLTKPLAREYSNRYSGDVDNKKCFTWSMGNTSDAEHMFQDVTDSIDPHKYTMHKHKINK